MIELGRLLVACMVLTACGSHDTQSFGTPDAAVVSFRADVMPIMQRACAVGGGSCHGPGAAAAKRPQLGDVGGAADPDAIYGSLVGVRSLENPTMDQIAPGDTAGSFLMHKMDGDQANLAAQCAMGTLAAAYPRCGDGMPQGYGMPLPEKDRALVRNWIAQGALDN